MLIGELYKLKDFLFDKEDNTLKAVIELNVDHEIFKGHFPDNPILPGVCQIEIVGELLSKYYNKDHNLSAAKNIKFLSVVNPVVDPELVYLIKVIEQNDEKMINAISSFQNGNVCFKLNGTFI